MSAADPAAGAVKESRKLGPVLATVLVAGNQIGSGVYLLPVTLAAVGGASILGWAVCTGGALLLAAVFSLLAVVRPGATSMIGYVEEALGDYLGFQAGMTYWFSIWTGVVPIAVVATAYLSSFFPVLKQAYPGVACTIAVIWLFTAINVIGPKLMGRVGLVTLALGLAPVIAAGTFGWLYFKPEVYLGSWNVSGKPTALALSTLLVPIFWAFLGVESAAVAASVVKNPRRDIPIASIGGTLLAGLVYMLATTAISGIISAPQLQQTQSPFTDVFLRILGPAAAVLVTVCAILKTSGTVGGWILITGETTRASAMLGHFPRLMARVSPNGSPVPALVVMAGLMSVVALLTISKTLSAQFERVISVSTILSLIVYVYVCLALLRFAPGFTGTGSRALARACAAAAILFCVAITAMSLIGSRGLLITTVLVLAATVPLWLGLRWAKRRRAIP
ncbi:MAG TPA: amino acid permease [Caulobacteraceae bacterium]